MAKRRDRILVLLDTSVLVRIWANPNGDSPSAQIWQLWLARQIQLVVSLEVVAEYIEILERKGHSPRHIEQFVERLETRSTVTRVNLGRRIRLARDSQDEHILATADAAQVKYLITLDKDLLEISPRARKRFTFEIVTPSKFLEYIGIGSG